MGGLTLLDKGLKCVDVASDSFTTVCLLLLVGRLFSSCQNLSMSRDTVMPKVATGLGFGCSGLIMLAESLAEHTSLLQSRQTVRCYTCMAYEAYAGGSWRYCLSDSRSDRRLHRK